MTRFRAAIFLSVVAVLITGTVATAQNKKESVAMEVSVLENIIEADEVRRVMVDSIDEKND